MTELVVGNGNEFTFEMVNKSHEEEIVKHIRDYFLRTEAIQMYLGWEENSSNDHEVMVRIALQHGYSFLVRETASGELAGVQILMDTRLPGLETRPKPTSINLPIIDAFFEQVEQKTKDILQRDFKCDFYADVFITSVAPKYRGRGLGTEIYTRLIPFLRAKGFPVLRSSFTSPATRKIGAKFGFTEIGKFYFKDAFDKNGIKYFPKAGDGKEEYLSEIAYIL